MKIVRLLILFLFIAAFASYAQEGAPGASIAPAAKDPVAPAQAPADNNDIKPDEPAASDALGLMVMDIKPSEKNASRYSIELRNTPLLDLFRLMARDYSLNIVVDDKVSGTITASLSDIGLEEALQTIVDMKNLKMEKKGRVIIIRPNLIARNFALHHLRLGSIVSVETTSNVTSSSQGSSGPSAAAPVAGQPAGSSASAENKETSATSSMTNEKIVFQKLLSSDGYVIPDVQGNSFMVVDYPENVEKVADFIKMADREKEKRIIKLQYVSANDLMGGQAAK